MPTTVMSAEGEGTSKSISASYFIQQIEGTSKSISASYFIQQIIAHYYYLMYLFMAVLGIHCSEQAAHWGWLLLLRSTGSGVRASVVMAHGLGCPTARGIFPDQEVNLYPLLWQVNC